MYMGNQLIVIEFHRRLFDIYREVTDPYQPKDVLVNQIVF